jgi:hypothetical protein
LQEWQTAIAALHEEHERSNKAMELVDQMKEKLGAMAAVCGVLMRCVEGFAEFSCVR